MGFNSGFKGLMNLIAKFEGMLLCISVFCKFCNFFSFVNIIFSQIFSTVIQNIFQ